VTATGTVPNPPESATDFLPLYLMALRYLPEANLKLSAADRLDLTQN